MKVRHLLLVLLLFTAFTGTKAQLFVQDFSSSSTLSNYISATPNSGQWNAISTSGAGVVISINTTTSNKLRFVRTGNAGAFSRTTDFSPVPSTLIYKFDLNVPSSGGAQTNSAVFQVGSGFGTTNAAEAGANVHSRVGMNFTGTSGNWQLREIGGGTNSATYTGIQSITWVINNSGATTSYTAPDGSNESVANDTWDLWVGTTRVYNEIAATTASQTLTDLKFAFTAGNGTIDMDNFSIDVIPTSVITVTPASLSAFTTTQGTPSAEQSYNLSGSGLSPASGNLTVNALSGYEYSLTSGGTFTTSLTVPYSGSTLASTPIYVRLAGTTPGSYNGNISNSGGNATAQNVAVTGSVNSLTPFLSSSPTSLTGFSTITGTASASQNYTLSGLNLSPAAGTISVAAPTGFEVSNDNANFAATTTAAYTAGGTFNNPSVYVRIAASTPAGSPSGSVNNSGGGATAINVAASGLVSPVPVLTATPTSLTGFSTITGTASAAQTFNLSSTTLLPASGTITVTAPTNYEVSLNGSTYAASVNAAYTGGGTFANPTVYVRIKASAPVGSPSGNVTTSGGSVSTPPSVAVSGTVAPVPAIVVNPTSLTGFVTPQGTPSAEQSYTLTGSNLSPASGNLSVGAVSGFEYSLTSGGTFTTTLTVPYTGGAISTTVYVRLTGSVANSYSGNAANSGGGATTQNVALSGTVNPGPPFVVINKVLNGSTATADEIELLVINNNADLRGLIFKDYSSNGNNDGGGVFTLTNDAAWNNVPSGTLIRITGAATAPDVNPVGDFSMTVGRANTTYFTQNIGAFDIAQNDIVMLKSAGSSTSGSTGAIHTLAVGSAYNLTNFTNAPGYRLHTNNASPATNQYAIATNPTSTLNDFNSTNASITSSQVFLEPNNTTNSVYICTLRGNNAQPTVNATFNSFSLVGPNTITVNWTNPVSNGGANRIVVARLTSTTPVPPTDGVDYNTSTVFSSPNVTNGTTGTGNVVVYDGTGTTVTVTGLANGTSYTFDVYEYNGISFCANYNPTPASASHSTQNTTTVQFVSATATTGEGSGTYSVVLSITNPSPANATTGQINFLSSDPNTTGQAADINNFNIGSFTFPANSSANQTVTLTITDDGLFESTEAFVFALQNVAGGASASEGTINEFTLSITDNEVAGTTIYSTGTGIGSTDAIWSYNPVGTGQTISSLVGGFTQTAGKDFVIQTGHTVTLPSGQLYNMNNLTVQTGAQLYRNSFSPLSYAYINLFGNATINGVLGSATATGDGLGINLVGTSTTIAGTGTVNIARLKKAAAADLPASNPTPTATTAATLNINMNLWHVGTCIHNEAANSTNLNITVATGKTVTVQSTSGDVAIDGLFGSGTGNSCGTYTINGTLNINGSLHAKNDNTAGTAAIVVGNTGIVNVNTANLDLSSGTGTAVTFGAGGKLNVSTALNLISGTVTSSANIVLKSGPALTAYLDNFSSGYTGSVNGTIVSERYITNGPTGFRYIAAPVNTGGNAMNLSAISGFVITGTAGFIIPLANCDPNNVAWNSPYGNFMRWEENGSGGNFQYNCRQAGWFFQTSGSMTVGRGYGAKISSGQKITYTGTPNTGNINYGPIGNTNTIGNGWHLVSNPYPSNIAISNVDVPTGNNMPTGFDGQLQFYLTSGPYTGTYLAYNVGLQTAPISLGQGFWVHITGLGNSATWALTNAYRVTNSVTYYNDESPILYHLKVDVAGNNFMDQTDINFVNGAQAGFDFYDANKWMSANGQPTLYTTVGTEMLSINSLPPLSASTPVPMGFSPGQDGNFTLTFSDIASLPPTAMVYLEDLQLGITQDLRANNTYSYSSTTNDNTDRFIIHFQPGVQSQVVDANCDHAGSIELTQPGTTFWDNYTVKDNANNLYAQGTNYSGVLTINNLQPQEYIVTLNHASGYVAQEFITVNGIADMVTTSLNASATNVLVNEVVSFVGAATNATDYAWNFGDNTVEAGTATAQHTYAAPGVYNVTFTASNANCSDVAVKTITVANPTGITTTTAEDFTIYGMGNHLVVEFNNWAGNQANMVMYNALGQNVATFNNLSTINGRTELQLQGIKPGCYFVQVSSGNKTYNRKLVLGNN